MTVRFPDPLVPGDTVGVTGPSMGVPDVLSKRLDVAVDVVEQHGYEVTVGSCLDGAGHVSAPAADRAAELMDMLVDPQIKAIIPPWGGETAIDLLPLLDWDRLRSAPPTWVVGFSDMSTIITPLTLLTGVATVHGNNLMDTPYNVADGLLSWLDIVTMAPGMTFTQTSPNQYRSGGFDDWEAVPDIRDYTLDARGGWTRLDSDGDVDVEGYLIGGCIETLSNVIGTPYAGISAFPRDPVGPDNSLTSVAGPSHPDNVAEEPGLLIYVEAAGDDAYTICRSLHGMRLTGFFDAANAVLVGRTLAPDGASLTQHEAVMDALGPLNVPIVADVECGHVPPYMPIVNGAYGRVVHTSSGSHLTQTL